MYEALLRLHAGRARLPRPAGTDDAVPRLRRPLQRLPQRHPPGGAFDLKQATWAYRNALADARDREVKAALAVLDIRAWFRRMRWRRGDPPISTAPEYEDYLFEQWSHGIFDDYWRQPGIHAEGFYDRYADVPIVHLSGWYDPYARTAMENYVGLSRAKRSRMHLILGPWTHGDRSLSHAGEVEFGPAAPVDGNLAEDFFELRRRWLDRWIKGLANGVDEELPVRVFVTGGSSGRRNRDGRLDHGGRWRSAAEWPLPQTRWTPLYLHADRSLAAEPAAGSGAVDDASIRAIRRRRWAARSARASLSCMPAPLTKARPLFAWTYWCSRRRRSTMTRSHRPDYGATVDRL